MNAPFPIPTGWTRSLPLARPSRAFGFTKFLSPFPQTAQVHPSAQGCEARATLGHAPTYFPQPQRGCITIPLATRYNPVGVDLNLSGSPRVASRTRQPWAGCRYPVGVNQPVMKCHRLGIPPNPHAKCRQSVTNCHQLKTSGIFITQPVTNCYQLKIPSNPRNLIPSP